jgi:hypothetical protein
MRPSSAFVRGLRESLPPATQQHLQTAIDAVVSAKERGGRVVAVTGSGPNIHEGVTTLIAELIRQGVVDGVITSSAVVAHEMGGTLDRVKRIRNVEGLPLPVPAGVLPRGGVFEITVLSDEERAELAAEYPDGWDLYERLRNMPGNVVIKAAGNMAWPMGLRTERLARFIRDVAAQEGLSFERVAGRGADPRTMLGAGARANVPVLVSIPQLVGGGAVGIAVGDAIPIARRAAAVADMLAGADVIIESAIALSQEIHDGPFETYTGHGIWAAWEGMKTYSLEGKRLVRIDLDPNLELAWRLERESADVQGAIDQGLPKTKRTGIPFRMEMSGFARLEGSVPVTADIGVAWPVLADELEQRLGLRLEFLSAPQESEEGRRMREWIASEIRWVERVEMLRQAEGTRDLGVPVATPAR